MYSVAPLERLCESGVFRDSLEGKQSSIVHHVWSENTTVTASGGVLEARSLLYSDNLTVLGGIAEATCPVS